MERFHIDLTTPKPFTLMFPHIPKTGGTTLLYHFRRNFGDNNILSYGPHNRNVRFFEDLPQLEELPADAAQSLRVVQGHGVSQGLVPLLPEGPVRLLVVLRHPVGLTRSRFNQRRIGMAARGIDVSSEQFLQSERGDFMSHLLINKFRAFIDPRARTRKDRVISILRKFDYVYTTEQMDAQVGGLMQTLGLPGTLERRRVSEKKAPLDIDDAALAEMNPLDSEIFELANHVVPDADRHNPFGFDAEGREEVFAAMRAARPDPDDLRAATHAELAYALCMELRAEAALAKLDAGGPVALADPQGFSGVLQEQWAEAEATLTDRQREISAKHLADWKQRQ